MKTLNYNIFSYNLFFVDKNKFVDSFLINQEQNEQNKVNFLMPNTLRDNIKVVIFEKYLWFLSLAN